MFPKFDSNQTIVSQILKKIGGEEPNPNRASRTLYPSSLVAQGCDGIHYQKIVLTRYTQIETAAWQGRTKRQN